ncbi:hypothetical protein Pmani_023078 [Petrolisthes manimaculis]|uniref:Uncharacterized protein n=1 Tax=Petrolisthes manimaculis TaxID=1843537 RepID=A0AAE1PCZ8_9EUCA|nr:hypothetical protein Pmani_023078 [Petrolisthes manimaculis]
MRKVTRVNLMRMRARDLATPQGDSQGEAKGTMIGDEKTGNSRVHATVVDEVSDDERPVVEGKRLGNSGDQLTRTEEEAVVEGKRLGNSEDQLTRSKEEVSGVATKDGFVCEGTLNEGMRPTGDTKVDVSGDRGHFTSAGIEGRTATGDAYFPPSLDTPDVDHKHPRILRKDYMHPETSERNREHPQIPESDYEHTKTSARDREHTKASQTDYEHLQTSERDSEHSKTSERNSEHPIKLIREREHLQREGAKSKHSGCVARRSDEALMRRGNQSVGTSGKYCTDKENNPPPPTPLSSSSSSSSSHSAVRRGAGRKLKEALQVVKVMVTRFLKGVSGSGIPLLVRQRSGGAGGSMGGSTTRGGARRPSMAGGPRRQLSRRSSRRDSRRGSKATRRRSSVHPPVHMPIKEAETEDEKEDKPKNPIRRLSRMLSNAGPALVRRVSKLRRKSLAPDADAGGGALPAHHSSLTLIAWRGGRVCVRTCCTCGDVAGRVFRAYRRARVYEAGRAGLTPPGSLATVAARTFTPLDPEAPGDEGARAPVATISGTCEGLHASPVVARSPRGAVPTLLEKVHRYMWPRDPAPPPPTPPPPPPQPHSHCREITITQWLIRRFRRLSFFHKKRDPANPSSSPPPSYLHTC